LYENGQKAFSLPRPPARGSAPGVWTPPLANRGSAAAALVCPRQLFAAMLRQEKKLSQTDKPRRLSSIVSWHPSALLPDVCLSSAKASMSDAFNATALTSRIEAIDTVHRASQRCDECQHFDPPSLPFGVRETARIRGGLVTKDSPRAISN